MLQITPVLEKGRSPSSRFAEFCVGIASVALTVLSQLLERVAEQACGDTWRNIKGDLRRIKLAQFLRPNGTVWQVTEPAPDAVKRLKSLKIQKPPPILRRN